MFVMSMLDRLTDVKKSTYAKIIAVLVSVAMVLSLTNMSAFAEGDGLSGIFGGNSDVVKVAVDLDNAKIEYGDQTVTNADKTFVASAGKDLKFKASAVTEDFTLDEVALVTTAENGDEVVTDLEGIDGTYTIEADDVAEGITIKASATEMAPAENQSIQETAAQAEQAPAKAARAGQWNNGNNYVTENINQNSANEYLQGNYVFIFLKVNEGDNITGIDDKYKYTDGVNVWYTYGYVQVDGLRTAKDYYDDGSKNDPKNYVEADATKVNNTIDDKIKAGVGEGSITLLDGNSNVMLNGKPLDFKAAGFWSFGPLLAANKAQGVTAPGAQTRTWHKNITLKDTRTVTVEYVDDKGNSLKEPDVTTVVKGGSYDVRNSIPDTISTEGENATHYALDSVDGTISGNATGSVTITAKYAVDTIVDPGEDPDSTKPGDGIPDKYQATVDFAVNNGSYVENFATHQVLTFNELQDGKWVEKNPAPVMTVPVDGINVNPTTGYGNGAWDDVNPTGVVVKAGDKLSYTYKYTINKYTVTVNYVDENNNPIKDPDATTEVEHNGSYNVDSLIPDTISTEGENATHYALDSVDGTISGNATGNVTITAKYAVDTIVDPGEDPDPTEPGDGVPDKYQATVLFTTADETQGTVGGDTTKVYTLRDAAGNLVESAEVELDADGVTTTAAEGYVFFNWTGAEFGTQTLKGNDVVTFVANWAEDTVGTDPANPDQGDGIPDMYQARVNFVAVNGSVNIPYTYVTLLDENGQPSENGTGYLTAEQIAVATAAEGYDQDSLAWDVVPTTENAITGEVTYTATFTANQPVVPVNPDNPGGGTTPTPAPAGPVPGAAPAALAPVAAALAAPVAALIGDEPTPLAEEAIGDEEDPLAAFDHVNCWVHYYMILGILLTLVYGGCVIARRSNYSRKIQKMDNYATGKAMDTVEETENVANAAAQKMEA